MKFESDQNEEDSELERINKELAEIERQEKEAELRKVEE